MNNLMGAKPERAPSRITSVSRVYLIIALFVVIILCLVSLIQIQMDVLTAVRAYVGGEGFWAKAQKDAVRSLEHYAISHDEADYQSYRHFIQVPLGDRQTRIELQKPDPNLDIARAGFLQGRNHPVDIEYMITFFRRFQHIAYMTKAIGHWTAADLLIAELNGVAEALHKEIVSGRDKPEAVRALFTRMDTINRYVTVEEDSFSSTLAEASRWANDVSRNLTYAIELLFVVLGIALSWPIITRIRATENALFESEADLRALVEHSPIAMLVDVGEGADEKIVLMNQKFTGLFGYTMEDVPDVRRWWPLAYPDEKYREELMAEWSGKVEKAIQSHGEIEPMEVTATCKDGSSRYVRISFASIGSRNIVTFEDLTERKRAEDAIHKQQELTTQIIETVPIRVFWKDRDSRYQGCNTLFAKDAGLTRHEEMIGKTDFEMGWKDQAELYRADDLRVMESGVSKLGFEEPQTTPDGKTIWLRTSKLPLRDAAQSIIGILGIYDDITGQKLVEDEIRKLNEDLETKVQERTGQLLKAQEELVRKEKLAVLGQVAGSVGHELRNPLGVMSNAVYFLQTVLVDADDSIKEYLDIIKSEIAGSERIVADLLDSVRTQPPRPESVGAGELIDQTLRKYTAPASVTVKLDIPAALPLLRVDAMQIQQVFRNLISNGVEAMPEGGALEIRAIENKPYGTVTVSVRDTGTGMTPEQLGKLFQPLFTTKARGIGLGLVVVKNLTQANGGTVEVQSEAGKGTLFAVTLPAADETGVSIPL